MFSTLRTAHERAQVLVEGIADLPSLPAAAAKVLGLVERPESTAREVADAISLDPALTARVLRVVNSAAYGMSGRVKTINHAVVVMGLTTLRAVVVGVAVADQFRVDADRSGLDPVQFWSHSGTCAVACRQLARFFPVRNAGELSVAGLLHDMGRLVLARYFAREYRQALRLGGRNGAPTADSELEAFGCTHAEVGGCLADRWNLPQDLRVGARHHHLPAKAGDDAPLAAVVHLADVLAHAVAGSSGEPEATANADVQVDPAAWQALARVKRDLDTSEILRFRVELERALDEAHGLAAVMMG